MRTEQQPLVILNEIDIGFGETNVARNISTSIAAGEMLALVGESGSGKSVTARSILQLNTGANYTGTISFNGEHTQHDNLLECSGKQLRHLRGNRISMIFQEPLSALNALHTVEKTITEIIQLHNPKSKADCRLHIFNLLKQVELAQDPASLERFLTAYPHQLSGGQRQRVMIAMALANDPELLIADEPTTALDVTVAKQILDLLKRLQKERNMAILVISHDLNLVRRYAERISVMNNGEIIETAETESLFKTPQQEYTKQLLSMVPQGFPTSSAEETLSLETEQLKVWFPIKRGLFLRTVGYTKALNPMSITVRKGETLGIIGESGSGKSTLALAILRLISSEGSIRFHHSSGISDINALTKKPLQALRPKMQMVFQDPFSSLNPRFLIFDIVTEGLKVNGNFSKNQLIEKARNVLTEMNLDESLLWRYPHELSGGQRQRIAVARSLLLEPELLILDEPTSALDRTNQVKMLDILRDIQAKTGLTFIFISHDLQVVQAMSHRILVLKRGDAVETLTTSQNLNPEHPYTIELFSASQY